MATRIDPDQGGNSRPNGAGAIPFLGLDHPAGCVDLDIRLQLNESPVFQKMKSEGATVEGAIGRILRSAGANLKLVLIALVRRLVAGQAVVWYTGQFYALFFLAEA